MTIQAIKRDYSLLGPSGQAAVEAGLAAAQWYHTDIPRKEMKALMQRSDDAAIRDTAIWLGCLVLFGALGVYFWGSWLCVPFFLAYGVLYGSASDSRWHECGHGTAFKTRWMNDTVYEIACFMIMRNPVTWRWSHTRHHTDTVIVGRDPEIAVMRPPDLVRLVLNFFGILDVWHAMTDMVRNSFGIISAEEKTFIPEMEQPRAIRIARIWMVIYLATIAAAIYMGSILPLMLIGLPRLYGAWHHVMTGLLQHGGLADNVIDHRLNSRTVYMNPISRFIYWNMNYHVEHHMFPMVPYHALPRLHAMIKHDLPAPDPSIGSGYRKMIPAFLRQLRNEDYFLKRELPATAKPYREEFHNELAPRLPSEQPDDRSINKWEDKMSETWIQACAASDIDAEDVIRFDHAGRTFAIYRSPDDEYFATDGICTHEHAFLTDGLVMDEIIECPKHNGRFDYRTGEAKGAPVCVDLKTYPVKVEDGAVFISV